MIDRFLVPVLLTYLLALLGSAVGAGIEAYRAEKVIGRTLEPLETFCGLYILAPLMLVGFAVLPVALVAITIQSWMRAL